MAGFPCCSVTGGSTIATRVCIWYLSRILSLVISNIPSVSHGVRPITELEKEGMTPVDGRVELSHAEHNLHMH
jgi:hypothetical protein